jgi:hypothetical protein
MVVSLFLSGNVIGIYKARTFEERQREAPRGILIPLEP